MNTTHIADWYAHQADEAGKQAVYVKQKMFHRLWLIVMIEAGLVHASMLADPWLNG